MIYIYKNQSETSLDIFLLIRNDQKILKRVKIKKCK